VLLLTACGPVGDGDDSGTSGSGGAVRDGGTMTVALADDPDMLDPTLARTLVGRMVFMSMCEKLYDIDQKLNVVPQLAASPPTHLAGRAQRRDQAPPGGQVQRRHAAGRRGGQEVPGPAPCPRGLPAQERAAGGDRVDVVDPATVRIRLSQPFAPLPAVLADRSGMVMSPK
jgi:peptide/nickel transport system substrate-binding protein